MNLLNNVDVGMQLVIGFGTKGKKRETKTVMQMIQTKILNKAKLVVFSHYFFKPGCKV